jgi:hypothetical protein
MANRVCEQLAFRLFEKFVQQISSGNVLESVQALSGIAPILVVLAPYIYGFHSQAPSRPWLRKVCLELTGALPLALQNRKAGVVHRHARGRERRLDHDPEDGGRSGGRQGEELVVVCSLGEVPRRRRPGGKFPADRRVRAAGV